MKGILIAAPGTGAGKTTVAAGLMAALRRRKLRIQPFKCGPDFIDPGHHALICGVPSHNLDTWLLPVETNRRVFAAACRDADVAIVEGMMGLFDGVRGSGEEGSSAEIAKLLGLPVLLVVDASTSAGSVAALVHGFQSFDPAVRVIGVLLNRVAGAPHAELLIEALRQRDPDSIIGWLPHRGELHLQERYLGLETASERSWSSAALDLLADLLERYCPLDRWLKACEIVPPPCTAEPPKPPQGAIRLGVARDRAFCFYYQAGLEELRRAGAEIVEFSPLADAGLPPDLDALYFGGGYPELYAETLSGKKQLFAELREFAHAGKPIYGECGGLIFLSRELITKNDARWPMAGLLPLSIAMADHLVHFGYAEIEFVVDGLAPKGTRLRGHSFHCSQATGDEDVKRTAIVRYSLSRQSEREGFSVGNVFGSYIHVHFASDPSLAARFVLLAQTARKECGVSL
jgi:cobyrinic acid a,c-diamide synthase